MPDLQRFTRHLGHQFEHASLLDQALTHRSAAGSHNERLEFLGDAVLNLTISSLLFRQWPEASEGELSRLRSSLVKRETLAQVAREIDLGTYLRLGSGELKSGGYRRDSILADGLEAVLGAIFLDGGLDAARNCVTALFADRMRNLPRASRLKDPKTRLQERLQAKKLALPEYRIVETSGEAHARVFRVECRLPACNLHSAANGSSRRRAEQAAAEALLMQLDDGETRTAEADRE